MGQALLPYEKQASDGIYYGDAKAVAEAFEKNPDLIGCGWQAALKLG